MGRGRAKAKQTKVARELKYNSGGMDLDRLRADLRQRGRLRGRPGAAREVRGPRRGLRLTATPPSGRRGRDTAEDTDEDDYADRATPAAR